MSNKLPESDIGVKIIIPNIATFICAIDEYAIIRLMSTWRNVEKDVNTIETTHMVTTRDEKYCVAIGNTGNNTRKKPYPPTFRRIAAKITDPSVGDST
jgi:hypothetical protein